MPKTKIVCTLGPACEGKNILKEMEKEGIDILRLNASFLEPDSLIKKITKIRKDFSNLAVLVDIKGPKLRLGRFPESRVLKSGEVVWLGIPKGEEEANEPSFLPVNFSRFADKVSKGKIVLIDDGKIKLQALEREGQKVKCQVLDGGLARELKTVNVPGVSLGLEFMSSSDRNYLEISFQEKVEFVAISFVRKPEEIRKVKKVRGEEKTKILAKIETAEALKNFEEILHEADGIMIARGDLGLETPIEKVPLVQKSIVRKCNELGKPVIIATHMLESMISNVVPTRSEVNDVANAAFDGTDAVMLSGESAIGEFPLAAVQNMKAILLASEKEGQFYRKCQCYQVGKPITDAIAGALEDICSRLEIKAILVSTVSGTTARSLASRKLQPPVFAFTDSKIAARQLNLTWGVKGIFLGKKVKTRGEAVNSIVKKALADNLVNKGDLVAIIAGSNIIDQEATNMLELREI